MDKQEKINEVAPPGSSGSVRAMILKHGDTFDPKASGKGKKLNPYAIAWAQHNKGAEWHYKEKKDKDTTKGKVPKKKEKFKDEDKPKKEKKHEGKSKKKKGKVKNFQEWVAAKETPPQEPFELFDEVNVEVSAEDIAALTPFQLAQKVKNTSRPMGMGPLAYAIYLKSQQGK